MDKLSDLLNKGTGYYLTIRNDKKAGACIKCGMIYTTEGLRSHLARVAVYAPEGVTLTAILGKNMIAAHTHFEYFHVKVEISQLVKGTQDV